MIRFLAIDFNQTPAAAVVARIHRESPIEIVSIGSISQSPKDPQEPDSSIEFSLDVELPDGGIDRSLAILNNRHLVYTSVELPFNDPKKIAQVVPLQLQDSLPFNVDECVMDTSVSKGSSDSSYRILAALSPSDNIAETLSTMAEVGVDPVSLSTHASALAELYHAAASIQGREIDNGLIALVNLQSSHTVVVVLLDGQPCFYREWKCESSSESETFAEIKATLAAAELEQSIGCNLVYVLGSNEILKTAQSEIQQKVAMLPLDGLVENHTSQTLSLDKYSWAIALAAREKLTSGLDISPVNFRKGQFAYQRAWGSLWEALESEATWFVLAIVFLLGFIGTKWWTVHHELSAIEKKIAVVAAQANTEDSIPERNEISFLESAIEDRESQLLEMGSLASLSPLESLRLLSTTISPNIQVEIDSVTIGFSRILLRGTVQDTPTLGTLETALKVPGSQFCAVNVDPTGRESGSSRQRFTAEIEVCE